MKLRRKTREAARHERATVLQQLGDVANSPLDWQRQREIETARMRRALQRGGGRHAEVLGLVTKQPPTACSYCGVVGGHSGQCPVIS